MKDNINLVGKTLGAIAGYYFFGIIGAVIFASIGHFFFDEKSSKADIFLSRLHDIYKQFAPEVFIEKCCDYYEKNFNRDFWKKFRYKLECNNFRSDVEWENIKGKLTGGIIGLATGFPLLVILGIVVGHFIVDDPRSSEIIESRIGDEHHKHWGKITGALFGLAAGGPLFCFFGLIGGHLLDRSMDDTIDDSWPPKNYTINPDSYETFSKKEVFKHAVIILCAKMAKADGRTTKIEIKAFRDMFDIPAGELRYASNVFDSARKTIDGYEQHAEAVARIFHDEPQMLEEIINILFAMAMADNILHISEEKFLRRVAKIFNVPSKTCERLKASFESTERANPYAILGVSDNASKEEIKTAWHKLTRDNHPDTLMAKGMPEEFAEAATKKMAAINAAYDKISKDRGIK